MESHCLTLALPWKRGKTHRLNESKVAQNAQNKGKAQQVAKCADEVFGLVGSVELGFGGAVPQN